MLKSHPKASREAEREILRRRASVLANRRRNAAEQKETQPYLLVHAHGEPYALALGALSEVIPLENVCQIPGSGPELTGIISHRGELTAVFDLAVLLGLPREEGLTGGFVLLLRSQRQAGLLVEKVAEVLQLAEEDLDGNAVLGETLSRLCRAQTAAGINVIDTARLLGIDQLGKSNCPSPAIS